MLIIMNSIIRVHARYLSRRGRRYYFYLRVPSDLRKRFGKEFIRESLKTTDERLAVRKAEARFNQCSAYFKALRDDPTLTPADTVTAGSELAKEWGTLDLFVDEVVRPKLQAHVASLGLPQEVSSFDLVGDEDFLSAIELEALKSLGRKRSSHRLSDAFEMYRATHRKAHDKRFLEKVQRDWDAFVAGIGDLHIEDLTREHARRFIASRVGAVKTSTIRRSLNHLAAVVGRAWKEWGINRPNPFESLAIPGEGHDEERRKVPSRDEVRQVIEHFKSDGSSTSLLIRLQALTGARIGELSGLALSDVQLQGTVPHLVIASRPWRSLKTQTSVRKVPLVGVALEAAREAVQQAGNSTALFAQYARERGADSASAAVNKRLVAWSITSHSFRHWLKDALREVGCTKDLRDAIQGHGSNDIADNYGEGHSLASMKAWLEKVDAGLSPPA